MQKNIHHVTQILIFLILTLISLPLSAQKYHNEGYYVSLAGDTVRGTLDWRQTEKSPLEIRFRKGESGDFTSMSPMEIRAFGVDEEIYRSAVVEVNKASRKTAYLRAEKEPEIVLDTVFLQLRMEGAYSLYYLMDQGGTMQFYVWRNGSILCWAIIGI